MDHSKGWDIGASMHVIHDHKPNAAVGMSQGLLRVRGSIDKARLEFVVDLVLRQSMVESGLVESHGGVGEPTQCPAQGESTLQDPHGASGDLSHGLPWMQG